MLGLKGGSRRWRWHWGALLAPAAADAQGQSVHGT